MGEQKLLENMKPWRAARSLTMTVYRVTEAADFEEDSDLRRQMRRASAAMMSDVAELYEAPSRADSHRSIRNARSSVIRLQSHLAIAADRYYIEPQTFEQLNHTAQELKEAIVEYFAKKGARSEERDARP
ncbi:MAG TPA: four helix bundle protein [Thermoanaerobaculia bacterium]